MTGPDHRPDQSFGFARGPRDDQAKPAPPLRLIDTPKVETGAEPAGGGAPSRPGPRRRTEMASSAPEPPGKDGRWVVRPGTTPQQDVRRPVRPTASSIAGQRFATSMPPAQAPIGRGDKPSRRWIALCLASMVYVVGIAGLWSMYQTFERPEPRPLTPAGDSMILPPLDETIDVRDALLRDGLFRPKFKPDINSDTDKDVAGSDLQTRS